MRFRLHLPSLELLELVAMQSAELDELAHEGLEWRPMTDSKIPNLHRALIGASVQFVDPNAVDALLAGVITRVRYNDGDEAAVVDLCTFVPGSHIEHRLSIPFSEDPAPGCWSWPITSEEAADELVDRQHLSE